MAAALRGEVYKAMEKVGVKEIRQNGMNPWKKNLKRMVFSHEGKFFISGSRCYRPELIKGKEYTEVEQIGVCWFIK